MSTRVRFFLRLWLVVLLLSGALPYILPPPLARAEGGTFPSYDFNGLQINYNVSGADVWGMVDSGDFTRARTYGSGRFTGDTFRLYGAAITQGSCRVQLRVQVTAGDQTLSQNYNLAPDYAPLNYVYSVQVPVPAGAVHGSFAVDMYAAFGNGEGRGVRVSGSIDQNVIPPTLTREPTATVEPTVVPEYDITIKAVEYTQAIQCLDQNTGAMDCADNSVPLVEDKGTVVRIYPQVRVTKGQFPGGYIDAYLFIDSPIQGAISSLNGPIWLKTDPNRKQIGDSLNYRLPLAWTEYGDIRLHVELNADHALPETDYTNNRRDMTLTFSPRRDLRVLYVPISYAPPEVVPITPTSRIRTAYYFAQKVYPLQQGGLQYYPGAPISYTHALHSSTPESPNTDTDEFMLWLNKLYAELPNATEFYDQLVGWLPDISIVWLPQEGYTGYDIAGSSDPLWFRPPGQGRVAFAQDRPNGYLYLSHEMAHNLGRHHPNTADSDAWDRRTDWPYANGKIQEEGFDPFANGGQGAIKPGDVISDVMTYQWDQMWVSPHTYKQLYAADNRPSVRLASAQTQDVLVVSGMLSRAGSATLDPIFRVASAALPPDPPAGPGYCLELQDAAGQVLRSTCFDADFVDEDSDRPVDQKAFFFNLPFVAGTQRVVLKQGATTLISRAASAHAPAVTITAPTPGVTWSGGQTIRWTATDADGDPLEFSLFYSPDGGARWLPIDVQVTGNSHTLDTTAYPGGNQVRIRLLASDGFNTTSVDAGPFSVPRKGPRPVILDPLEGAHIVPARPLLLVGGGDDPEDGSLPWTAFSWSSDRDGALGTGRELDIAGLSRGTHHLTLAARDGDGNVGQETITVQVQPWMSDLPLIMRNVLHVAAPTSQPGATATRTETVRPSTPTATRTQTTPPSTATTTRTQTARPPTATATRTQTTPPSTATTTRTQTARPPTATATRTPPAPPPTATRTPPAPSASMSEGFEGAWPSAGWRLVDTSSADDGEYLLGKRDCHPHDGSFAGWTVGGGAQGSALACGADYPASAESWAIYGPFSLVGATSATLSFYLNGESELGIDCSYDYFFVGSSTNGSDLTSFEGQKICGDYTSGSDGNGYSHLTFDLSSRLGQSQVWVALSFVSDSSIAYGGFSVDDVSLSVSSDATPSP